MKYKAILFDLDNTLANSEDFMLSSKKNYDSYEHLAEYKAYEFLKDYLKIVDWETYKETYLKARKLVKKRLEGTAASHNRYLYIQRTLELLGATFNPEIVLEASEIHWNTVIKSCDLFPNVKKVLKQIKEKHLKIVVVTDQIAQVQIRLLQKLDIEPFIDYLVTSEEVNADKPNKGHIELVEEKLGISRSQMIMIGNNPKTDVELGHQTGVDTVLFDFYKVHKDGKNNPSQYITNFNELINILDLNQSKYDSGNVIVLDLMGTLTKESSFFGELLLKNIAVDDKEKAYEAYKKFRRNEINEEEFWNKLKIHNYNNIIGDLIDKITLSDDLLITLKNVSEKYPLCILSNLPKSWGDQILDRFELKKYFETILFSGEFNTEKPNIDLYHIILNKYPNIAPYNFYFVDNELKDLSAGKDVLMNTVWIKNNKTDNYNYIPDHVIENIGQLEDIITEDL